ncbi:hypothetical protein BCR43DRAFT_242302 [Syncephalastrum racemosum]|uniref:Uncharacterized protein n=1 Tax=Syncephalastrum racemosum TaxID=13706 RepID=A0A1X2HF10_SYNRA|nr:hypothetical protein BCR43DRAFT_242302 [Syncephalastrum racemosum]
MVPGKPHLHWSCFINRILGRPIEGSTGSHHNHNRYPFKHKAPSTTLLSTDTVVSSLHRNVPSALKSDHSSSSHLSTLSESSGESLPTLPSSPLSLTTSLSSSISNFTTSADNVDLLSSLVKTTTRTAPRLYPDAVDILVSASARAQKTKTACLAYLNDMPGPRLMDRHFDTEPVLTENIATKVSRGR